MQFNVRDKDAGSIDPALDRKREFTVAGNKGLAGTAVIALNLRRCQAPDTLGGTCRAGALQEDNLALVAFPFSPADTFEWYLSLTYGIEYGGVFRYRDQLV
jgi:hypothetical protein